MSDQVAINLAEAQVSARGVNIGIAFHADEHNVPARSVCLEGTFENAQLEVAAGGVQNSFALQIGNLYVSARSSKVDVEFCGYGDGVIHLKPAERALKTEKRLRAFRFNLHLVVCGGHLDFMLFEGFLGFGS